MTAEPGKAALDDPVKSGDLERLFLALDDDEFPAISIFQVLGQPFALKASVCDHGMDCWPQRGQPASQETGRPAIGHTRGLDTAGNKKAQCINEHLPFAPLDPVVPVKTANAPFSVVLTD